MGTRGLVLVVAFFALLFHARAKEGDFLFHDDYRYVVNNEAIDRVGNPARFFTDLRTLSPHMPTKDISRPVRTLSYAVITALFGKESSAPFHLLAILLHAGTSVVLFLLLRRAGLIGFAAAVGALFFALSPVTVEVTAWVCSLGDSWCGLLAAASVLAYASDRRILAVAALAAAVFSKEHAIVVPAIWGLWDLLLRPERLRGEGRGAAVVTAGAGLAVVGGFLLFRSGVGAGMSQVPEPLGGSYLNAIWTMTAGLGWYAATIVLPFGPTFDAVVDVRQTPLDGGVFLGLLVLLALVSGLWKGPPRVRLGIAWFLIALVPVHNVFVPLKIPTADRFLYLPLMGLSFALGELAQRTYPFAARWMPAALLLLGVLTVTRIGDWQDSEALWSAGLRVNPKSRRLIWEEAAIGAQRAVHYSLRGDHVAAERIGTQAVGVYGLFLDNSEPAEQTQVYVELGDLFFELGRGRARFAEIEQQRDAQNRAMLAYLAARSLQRRGVGRTTEEEIRHVAERIVALAVDLVPGNEEPGPTITAGLEAAHFLKEEYGVDDTGARIVFRLADSVRVRQDEPAKAREGFTWVLDALDRMDPGGARFPFIRAQAHFYRAVLKDQDFNRSELELAFSFYVAAAKTDPAVRLRALAYAGRCQCTIGSLFRDAAAAAQGRLILQSLPRIAAEGRLRIDSYLKREIDSLEATCGR